MIDDIIVMMTINIRHKCDLDKFQNWLKAWRVVSRQNKLGCFGGKIIEKEQTNNEVL